MRRSRQPAAQAIVVILLALWLPPVTAQDAPGRPTVDPRAQLAACIDAAVDAPDFRAARWGILATYADSGETLYSRDADRAFVPGSNLKLYTTAMALAQLGATFRWRTSVYAISRPDKGGKVRGDLVIYGRGDPTISARFTGGDPLRRIEELADRIRDAGVRRVEGDLIADESYFTGVRFGYGWEWNDLQWGFGAEVSALSVGDNIVTVAIHPASRPGAPGRVVLAQQTAYVRFINRTVTTPKDGASDVGIYRGEGANVAEIWGHIPVGSPSVERTLAVHDPAGLFGQLLRDALARRQITVRGATTSIDARQRADHPFSTSAAIELAYVESDPLGDVVRATNKVSQNLYAELLLRTVGRVKGPADADSSEEAGVLVLFDYLRTAGIDTHNVVVTDGSGLSRRNLVTPTATVRLLTYVRTQSYGPLFFDSLPVGGNDGTLQRRFAGTAVGDRVHAKTGTLEYVSCLSGYVTTAAGRPVVFSIMVNNQEEGRPAVRQAIDSIVVALAEIP